MKIKLLVVNDIEIAREHWLGYVVGASDTNAQFDPTEIKASDVRTIQGLLSSEIAANGPYDGILLDYLIDDLTADEILQEMPIADIPSLGKICIASSEIGEEIHLSEPYYYVGSSIDKNEIQMRLKRVFVTNTASYFLRPKTIRRRAP